jgi:hypothetical protein
MAIDITNETCLTLSKAAKTLPRVRGSKPPHPLTLYRWATNGLKAKSGKRVFLETEFVGGTRVTSLEALERFIARKSDCCYETLTFKQEREQKSLQREAEQAVSRLRDRRMID